MSMGFDEMASSWKPSEDVSDMRLPDVTEAEDATTEAALEHQRSAETERMEQDAEDEREEALERESERVDHSGGLGGSGGSGGRSETASTVQNAPDPAPQHGGPEEDDAPTETEPDPEERPEPIPEPTVAARQLDPVPVVSTEVSEAMIDDPQLLKNTLAVNHDPMSNSEEREAQRRTGKKREGTHPQTYSKTGFAAEGESIQLRSFPKELVEQLRWVLGGRLGDAFADQVSNSALVTAFVISRMGLQIEVDQNTRLAVEAFRDLEPQLSQLRELNGTVESLTSDVQTLGNSVVMMAKRIGELSAESEAAMLAASYVITDRAYVLRNVRGSNGSPKDLEVDDPRVLEMVGNIRKRVSAQRILRKQSEGRSLS